jgi:hypothetical protein
MSIQPPQGILTIPNATLRVGRLQVDEVEGFDTVLNTFDKNTILEEDSEVYDDDKKWGVKMPNIFVATFEIKGAGSSFNFRNTSMGDAGVGYTLTFSGTTLTLKYNGSQLGDLATIPNLNSTYGKVYLTYEKQYFTVTVDGTRVLSYKDTGTRTFPDGEYINFFAGGDGGFKNLKVVAGHLISDGTSNVSLYGGLAVTSNLEVGSSNLFVDTVNSRVGVGTTTPEATLHVSGNAYVSSNLEVGSSNLFVDTVNSRVGVGTTTPEATLHVSGNAYVSSNLEVGSSNLFVDTVNSRVGVGTDTPKESLDVVGNMHLTRVSNVSQIKVDSNVVTEYTGPHDRPLRKYPEVAMTAATTGGYTVSRSSGSSPYDAWKAFDEDISTYWYSGSNSYYATSDGSATVSAPLLDTGTDRGDWLAIEIPNGIKLESFKLTRHDGGFPSSGTLYARNSSSDSWTEIYRYNGYTSGNTTQVFNVNSTIVYKIFALVGRAREQGSNTTYGLSIKELELYGYEEGSGSLDTTLKSVYNVPATTGTQLEVYYDAKDLDVVTSTVDNKTGVSASDASISNSGGTISFDSTYKAWTFGGSSGRTDTFRSSTLPSTFTGNQVHSITLWFNMSNISDGSIFVITPSTGENGGDVIMGQTQGNGARISYSFWGNDVSFDLPTNLTTETWYHLSMTYDATDNSTGRKMFLNGIECTAINTASGSLSLPNSNMIISFANRVSQTSYPFFGSIANFRLYSKALNADQVKELYDYQKDYFLGSKSQVTLYKGHLGVGVTEPSGQLELAGDERIQEYPPRAMTGYETLVEGHGVFCVSASTWVVTTYEPYFAFDNNDSTAWLSAVRYDNANGSYTGSTSTGNIDGTGTLSGEWLQISLPSKIFLKRSGWIPQGTTRGPKTGVILGSNNGSVWNTIHSFSDKTYSGTIETELFSGTSSTAYQYFRIIGSTIGAGARLEAREWKLFGTPGPTTLDKGSLSLGRSLDVPRVSRYDVDTETPRPEKLVVDFDTTVNSSPTDISGQGNHGTFYGATYSPADKAFKFDGTDDVIYNGGIGNWTDNISHTFSFWFKCESVNASNYGGSLVNLYNTTSTVNHYSAFSFSTGSSGVISFYHFGNDFTYNYPFELNRWYHVAGVYSGSSTTQKVYVDGVDLGPGTAAPGSDTSGLLLGTNPKLSLGGDFGRSDYYFDGQISNFKLYNVALEPSEVQKLYRLGRTGRSMVISDTAIGIGKVPEAQLDVRGNILYTGTSRPHALPTMWNHMDMGRNGPGVYPIIGTQGGSKVYNVYCEPDIFGGGWMCFTQIPQGGGGFNHNTVNLYTFDSGDSGNLKRTKFFNVPYNILSNTNGVNCDILVLAYGDILRYNMQGAKVGAIWRGVDLNTHFNSVINQSQIGYNAAQATSADGITFTSLSANLDKPSGWEFSISTEGNTTGSYNNYDDGTGGFIIHTAAGKSYSLYGHVRGPDGNWNYSSSTDFEIVRIFVRPSQF